MTSIPVDRGDAAPVSHIVPEPPRPGRVRVDRVAMDVSGTATEAFGARSVEYWGTLSFMLVEGMTLALVIAAYFYLIGNFESWPPPRVELPGMLWSTLCAATMLLACIPMWAVYRAAPKLETRKLKIGFALGLLLSSLAIVFRFLTFNDLNVKWYDTAYGSATWNVFGWHTALLIPDVADIALSAVIFFRGHAEPKHYAGAKDTALSWFFVTFTGAVVYLVGTWAPRLIP